jgi:hypothetical protein
VQHVECAAFLHCGGFTDGDCDQVLALRTITGMMNLSAKHRSSPGVDFAHPFSGSPAFLELLYTGRVAADDANLDLLLLGGIRAVVDFIYAKTNIALHLMSYFSVPHAPQ